MSTVSPRPAVRHHGQVPAASFGPRVPSGSRVPPGWPVEVRPPGSEDWELGAVGWLLDLCPPDYRGYPVLTRHPVALARLAALHVEGSSYAVRRALATTLADMSDVLPPPAMRQVLVALETEAPRLRAAARGVALVEDALLRQARARGLPD